MTAAKWIDDQLDSLAGSQSHQFRRPVTAGVVDRMRQATFEQKGMLARTGRAINRRAEMAGDVDRGQTHTASGIVDQHRVTRAYGSHHNQ